VIAAPHNWEIDVKTFDLTRSLIAASAFVSAVSLGTAAAAQGGISPGMQVVDQAGNPVGTVTSVKGANLVVKTDRHEVQLPASSFTPNQGKLLFGMTRDELNASTDQALADAYAKIAVGAAVHGKAGTLAGHIEALDDSTVTVKLTTGELIRLPRKAIAPADHGVVLGVTVDELKSMAASAGVQ
jgi:preprotein translocase subunit YajC